MIRLAWRCGWKVVVGTDAGGNEVAEKCEGLAFDVNAPWDRPVGAPRPVAPAHECPFCGGKDWSIRQVTTWIERPVAHRPGLRMSTPTEEIEEDEYLGQVELIIEIIERNDPGLADIVGRERRGLAITGAERARLPEARPYFRTLIV